MSLFDEPVTIESLLARVEALEGAVFDKQQATRMRTECPTSIKEAWTRWYFYRASRKGWTADCKRLNLTKLSDLSKLDPETALAIVNHSIEHSYTGLFPLKEPLAKVHTLPVKKRVEETPLERALSWARHQHHMGMIDADEMQKQITAATDKHRSHV